MGDASPNGKRPFRSRNRKLYFESLEPRQVMAASLTESQTLELTKTGPLSKGGQALVELYDGYEKFKAAQPTNANAAADYGRAVGPSSIYSVNAAGVGLDVQISGDFAAGLEALRARGATIVATSESNRVASIIAALDKVKDVVGASVVASARTIAKPYVHGTTTLGGATGTTTTGSSGSSAITTSTTGGPGVVTPPNPLPQPPGPGPNRQGIADNQADIAMRTDRLRQRYNLNGAGVKIGVLSDSYDAGGGGAPSSVSTGDLPGNVQVLQDYRFGSDEGRAMLELIYDIAPGSQLAFATAFVGGQIGFANNIRALYNAGSRVIVDDVSYFAEPYFQPGVIDAAINEVVNGGAYYFSSAANSGSNGYRGYANAERLPLGGNYDYDPNPLRTDTRMRINVPGGLGLLALQWSDNYNGLPDSSKIRADLDIRLYTPLGQLVQNKWGLDSNFNTGQPVEFISNIDPGVYDVEIRLFAGTAPDLIQLVGYGGNFTREYTGEFGISTSIGHNSGPWTVGVGAVPFNVAPAYSTTGPIVTETFSSVGLPIHTRDKTGQSMEFWSINSAPYLSAPDGTNTSFFGSDTFIDADALPNFFGTSAAAPNLAAAAALIRQRFPTATQAQVMNAMAKTAWAANGTPSQSYNTRSGYGLVNAEAAIAELIRTGTTGGVIIDDGSAGFSFTGNWTATTFAGYLGDNRVMPAGATGTATYVFSGLADGDYQLYANWTVATTRTTAARYTAYDGGVRRGSTTVNQRVAAVGNTADGVAWQSLGFVTVTNGQLQVDVTNGATGNISVDGMRLVYRNPLPANPPPPQTPRPPRVLSGTSNAAVSGMTLAGNIAAMDSVASAAVFAATADEGTVGIRRRR